MLTGTATLVKMLASFFIIKYIALYLGPSAVGVIGQFTSFTAIILALATGGITNGIVKFLAEYKNDEKKQQEILHTAIKITFVCSALVSVIVILSANLISTLIFATNEYYSVFVIFGITLIFYAFFNLLQSVLNGREQYRKYTILNISASLINLTLSLIAVRYFGLQGSLIAFGISQSVAFVCLVLFFVSPLRLKFYLLKIKDSMAMPNALFKYSLMTAVSLIAVPLTQIFVRNYITSKCGAVNTGYYESINRLSNIYLTVVTTTLSTYFLPRLSHITSKSDIRNEIISGYKLIIPILLVATFLIYQLRFFIISLAFAPEFLPMSSYFLPQFLGDFFRMLSWLLAMQMLAKAMTSVFVVTEVIFSITLLVFTVFFVNNYGAIGSIYAYIVNYCFYLLTMVFIFRKLIFFKNEY